MEGLGKHGLVSSSQTSNLENAGASNLLPLPVALKEELETRIDAYKLAVHKLESFGKHTRTHKGNNGIHRYRSGHLKRESTVYSAQYIRAISTSSKGLLMNSVQYTSPVRV